MLWELPQINQQITKLSKNFESDAQQLILGSENKKELPKADFLKYLYDYWSYILMLLRRDHMTTKLIKETNSIHQFFLCF